MMVCGSQVIVTIIQLFFVFPCVLVSAQSTYHLFPTAESECPHENCYNLSDIVSHTDRYISSNTTLMFLPGNHVLDDSILVLENIENIKFIGMSSSGSNAMSATITCNGSSAFIFKQVANVHIESITMKHCGSSIIRASPTVQRYLPPDTHNLATLVAWSVQYFQLINSTMQENVQPLCSYNSSVYINSVQFINNTAERGGAAEFYDATVTFTGSNVFHSNRATGGAITATHVNRMVFSGTTSFIANEGTRGGAIAATRSKIYFVNNTALGKGNQTSTKINFFFSQNTASIEGGGIHLWSSRLVQYQRTSITFTGNSAGIAGGAIWAEYSRISLKGSSVFKANTATEGAGGAIYLHSSCIWVSASFVGVENLANCGGLLFSLNSKLHFYGTTTVQYNSVFVPNTPYVIKCSWPHAGAGGGMFLETQSEIYFYNDVNFIGNMAESEGGAVYMTNHCKAYFLSNNSLVTFSNNTADDGGGGILILGSDLRFNGTTVMVGNKAKGGTGGALCAYLESIVSFFGSTIISGNSAWSGGGITANDYCVIEIKTDLLLSFSDNEAEHNGGWLAMARQSNLVLTGNANFTSNRAGVAGGAISLWNDTTYMLIKGNSNFINNHATFGGCIATEQGQITLYESHVFSNNSANFGGAIFANRGDIHLEGRFTFRSNTAIYAGYGGFGGGIHALKTRIVFNGEVNFTDNYANSGGGLALANSEYIQRRLIYMYPNSSFLFHNNYALNQGGGIAVEDIGFLYCSSYAHRTLNLKTPCFFQVTDTECNPSSLDRLNNVSNHYDIEVQFTDNWAENGGSDIYGGALEMCGVCDINKRYMLGIEVLTKLVGNNLYAPLGKASKISSDPIRVCICENLQPNCTKSSISRKIFPGETFRIFAISVGQMNGISPAAVRARFKETQEGSLYYLQKNQETTMACTPLEYTLEKRKNTEARLEIFAEGPCGELGHSFSISVNFRACPEGFMLSQSGICICEHRLQKYTNSCDINDRTITRSGDFWVGYDYQAHGLVLHPHCPFDYCIHETVSLTLNSTDLQCAHGRSGTLCGGCRSGLSLNLGTSRCSPCSNVYILLVLPFAVAGFLLVLFLFICKLTISTGTLSGLIFYANVVAANKNVFFPDRETNILTIFIAWLNLDLGIETCFINGMDAYTRTWLQFVFPIYIWSLVGLITLVTHYSMTVAKIIGSANPVSVLATLFLLSYTKLLRTIIATVSFTTLECPNDSSELVWAYDGNIGYIEGKHIALFLAGLLALLLLFLPYTLMLLFGQCLIAGSNYRLLHWANKPIIRSFLDAYHAPYQNHHRYWVGLLLALRFLLFVISAVVDINSPRDPSVNLLILVIVCTGLMVLTWNIGSLYKKWIMNVLESSFVFNLAVLAAASYQVKVEGGNQKAIIYTSVSIAFVTFLGIISFHIVECLLDTRIWRHSLQPRLQHMREKITHNQESEGQVEMVPPPPPAPPAVVPTTFIELREPLLDTNH